MDSAEQVAEGYGEAEVVEEEAAAGSGGEDSISTARTDPSITELGILLLMRRLTR